VIWRESGSPSFAASDVSFVVPVRKKLRFELVGMADDGAAGGMRGINPANGQCEAGLSWGDIGEQLILPLLPVPAISVTRVQPCQDYSTDNFHSQPKL
jgi:hypothetical protein